MLTRRLLLSAAPAALLVAGCTTAPAGTTSVAPAASAPANGATLDAKQFAAALQRPGTVVLDVRTPAEFAQGHLKGAVNVDVENPAFTATMAGKDKAASYAVYCRSGNRSQVALDLMTKAGFTSTYHLGGGIGAWRGAGFEVVTGA